MLWIHGRMDGCNEWCSDLFSVVAFYQCDSVHWTVIGLDWKVLYRVDFWFTKCFYYWLLCFNLSIIVARIMLLCFCFRNGIPSWSCRMVDCCVCGGYGCWVVVFCLRLLACELCVFVPSLYTVLAALNFCFSFAYLCLLPWIRIFSTINLLFIF